MVSKALSGIAVGVMMSMSVGAAIAQSEPIKFGILYDGSGGAAFYSGESVKGIELAVDEINRNGGILGRQVEVIKKDDSNNPTLAPLRTRELIEDGAVVTFMTSGSSSTLQARVTLAEEKIPGITPTNLNSKIVRPPNHEYMFSIANNGGQLVGFLLDVMESYEEVAIFADTSATGKALADIYKGAFESGGKTVVAMEAVDVGATDATAQVARLKDANPDVVFVSGQAAPEQALFLRARRDLGLNVPTLQDTTGQVPQLWELAGAAALEGHRMVDQIDPGNKKTDVVRKAFREKYGKDAPFLSFHAQGWDTAMLYEKAIEMAGSTDGTAIRDALENIQGYEAHWGRPGYTISCSRQSHLCASIEGMVLRGFDGDRPGAVVYP